MFMVVIDGTNLIFGRAASQIAKKLLNGEDVQLVNAEHMVMIGNPPALIERFKLRRQVQHKGTPERSPSWPKVPNLLVRRMIRGMLPWKKPRGKSAYKKLHVFTGNPKNLKATSIKGVECKTTFRSMTINELCKHIGYKNS